MKPQMVSSKVNAKVYSASSPNRSWKSSSKASSNFTPKSSAPPSPPKAKGGKKSSSDPCGCGGNWKRRCAETRSFRSSSTRS